MKAYNIFIEYIINNILNFNLNTIIFVLEFNCVHREFIYKQEKISLHYDDLIALAENRLIQMMKDGNLEAVSAILDLYTKYSE